MAEKFRAVGAGGRAPVTLPRYETGLIGCGAGGRKLVVAWRERTDADLANGVRGDMTWAVIVGGRELFGSMEYRLAIDILSASTGGWGKMGINRGLGSCNGTQERKAGKGARWYSVVG